MYPETPSICDPFLRPPLCGLILTLFLILTTLLLSVLGVRLGSQLIAEKTWLISLLWVIAALGLILSVYGLRKGCRCRMLSCLQNGRIFKRPSWNRGEKTNLQHAALWQPVCQETFAPNVSRVLPTTGKLITWLWNSNFSRMWAFLINIKIKLFLLNVVVYCSF